MDFKDEIRRLGERAAQLRSQVHTEEATKHVLVLPFIQCLGYDVFSPADVVPELTSDFGIKKGEKVDYAIVQNGIPVLLIECKPCGEPLDAHGSQLFRYFTAQGAKFGLLTNGIDYWFFTDLERQNVMDAKPFMAFDITQIKDATIEEVKRFHKSYFDSSAVSDAATELWYVNAVKSLMQQEFKTPSEAFVRFVLWKGVYEGLKTKSVVERFTAIVQKALAQMMADTVSERLQAALTAQSNQEAEEAKKLGEEIPEEDRVETTAMELEAFFIVKSMLRRVVAAERIQYRDHQTYFAVQLDNNSRKAICRLYLHGSNGYVGLFDQDKNETRHKIASLDDLFSFGTQLEAKVREYEDKGREEVKKEG